jgi:flagellar hook assembly protein FlgD
VATLVDEILPAGVHERAWDGRDARGRLLRSGVYYVRVETGAGAVSQTVVLTR